MRILHVIPSVNPASGGPIEGVKQLSRVNAQHGHRLEIVSLDSPEDEWVSACPLLCHALGPGRLQYRYSPRLVPWLKAKRHDYDAVIVNGIWQYNSFGTWLALHGTDTPYLVFPHGMLDPWFKRSYPLKHLKKWCYWPWAEYRVLRDAAAVLFTCEDERQLARESFWLYRCQEHVINYGTRRPEGDTASQKELFLQRFPSVRGKQCLLFIGRVHPKKGIDLLFRAFAQLVQVLSPAAAERLHLIMAGPNDHDYAAELRRLAEQLRIHDRITWTGVVIGDAKWGAFHVADAFVLPSHQENFGVAVAESLACGLPVLISNKVNIWREIGSRGAGIIDDDDLAGTKRMLTAWIGMAEAKKDEMRARARDCFQQCFDINHSATALIDLLASRGMARKGVAK